MAIELGWFNDSLFGYRHDLHGSAERHSHDADLQAGSNRGRPEDHSARYSTPDGVWSGGKCRRNQFHDPRHEYLDFRNVDFRDEYLDFGREVR